MSVPLRELVIVSKSPWEPPIRREHALARLANGHGHETTFIERPLDLRALRGPERRAWVRGVTPGNPPAGRDGVGVTSRSTILPAHLHPACEALDGRLLGRLLRRQATGATVVATLPWHWPAVSRLRGCRRVLDVADDWSALVPSRAERVRELYARAAREADAIVVVSDSLRELFAGRRVELVRNGVEQSLLAPARTAPPRTHRLAYVGTLSERFDAPLARKLLALLPGWTLELYGACAYRRHADRPAPELQELLDGTAGRVRLHGPIARERVVDALDGADVLLLPNRTSSRGQDSMKIYDYAARGRPVVATSAAADGISDLPPHLQLGTTADELAKLVIRAADEPGQWAQERVRWAAAQSWESRWPAWERALFGATEEPRGRTERKIG